MVEAFWSDVLPETVRDVSVPSEVRDDAVTPDARVVPTRSAGLIFSVEVATHCGTPDALVVRMDELDDASVLSAVEPEPYRREFDARDDRPVPPYNTLTDVVALTTPLFA